MDGNIVKLIKTTDLIDKDMVKKWQSVKGILIKNAIQTEIDVKASTSEAYKFDLEGLFINVIKIRPEYVYPHIIVNGYNSSQSYEGNRTKFFIIDNQYLSMFHSLFKRDKRNKKK